VGCRRVTPIIRCQATRKGKGAAPTCDPLPIPRLQFRPVHNSAPAHLTTAQCTSILGFTAIQRISHLGSSSSHFISYLGSTSSQDTSPLGSSSHQYISVLGFTSGHATSPLGFSTSPSPHFSASLFSLLTSRSRLSVREV